MAEDNNLGKLFELLSRAEKEADLTIRDDQGDFAAFLDAAKRCRAKGGRFRLIDTGKFGVFELEWLAEAGSDIYTSNEARPNIAEIGLLTRASSRGDAIIAYFHQGALARNAERESTSLSFLMNIGRSGAYVYLTNRDVERSFPDLAALAYNCRSAGTRLIYYHHGPLAAELADPGRNGAWIHLSDSSLEFAEDTRSLLDVIEDASAAGAGLVLHVERGLPLSLLRDIMHAGAFVLFATVPSGRGSSLRPLEQKARRRAPDFRAYYLYADFMP
jgi:hypothetical protein